MTEDDLRHLLVEYCAGVEAELSLLRQLRRLALEQHDGSVNPDFDRFTRIADERDRLLAGLMQIEHEIRPMREALLGHDGQVADLPQFETLRTLHRSAGELVGTIIGSDQSTLQALRQAETARRAAAQALEAGEATLAAYRRVIAPALAGAPLVDRKA
jgi:hypothetical protein